jgi:hypothetical protein
MLHDENSDATLMNVLTRVRQELELPMRRVQNDERALLYYQDSFPFVSFSFMFLARTVTNSNVRKKGTAVLALVDLVFLEVFALAIVSRCSSSMTHALNPRVDTLFLLCPVDLRIVVNGARGSVVRKALCYKTEGRESETRRDEFLNLPNPSGLTMPWVLLSL